MKPSIFCAFVMHLACICLQVNGDCEVDGELHKVGVSTRNCEVITCRPSGSFDRRGCARYECPQGTQVGVQDRDNFKLFPECCLRPICDLKKLKIDEKRAELIKKFLGIVRNDNY